MQLCGDVIISAAGNPSPELVSLHHDDQSTFSIEVKEVEQLNPHSKNYTQFRTITLKMNYTQENNIFTVFVINFIMGAD